MANCYSRFISQTLCYKQKRIPSYNNKKESGSYSNDIKRSICHFNINRYNNDYNDDFYDISNVRLQITVRVHARSRPGRIIIAHG